MIRKPHSPESLEALRARYPASVAHCYTLAELLSGGGWHEGPNGHHIFDFEDGLRLTVAKEDHSPVGMGILIHCAASFAPDSQLDRRARSGLMDEQGFAEAALARFQELSGMSWNRTVHFDYTPSRRIPHFYFPEASS